MSSHAQNNVDPDFQGTLFEENYLKRAYKTLTSNPEIALTELVANAWDAGASQVDVTIPEEVGQLLVVKDNGSGMTFEEFQTRWRKLNYNRLSNQGKKVEFPPDVSGSRIAFGRNGIGRHGLLCFNDEYTVVTTKNGIRHTLAIDSTQLDPIHIKSHIEEAVDSREHGLLLKTVVHEHKPDPDRILEVLTSRFVTDPNFTVYVNDKKVEPYALLGLKSESEPIKVTETITIKILFIDTTVSHRKSIYQGIAFWQAKRLVGEPSWLLGKEAILDGRTTNAKKFVFIVQSDNLEDYVKEDWTGFRDCPEMDLVYAKVKEFVVSALSQYNQEHIKDIKDSLQEDLTRRYGQMTALGRHEVSEAIEHIAKTRPTVSKETLEVAVEAVANVAQARSGEALFRKLASLDVEDIDRLNDLLSRWSITDALVVLDEIDARLSAIAAIDKLASNKGTDELHTLHPLVTASRWVFGPEFDSLEYRSNRQLRTIAKTVFHLEDANFVNPRKRPDLFVVGDSTFSMTGIEVMDSGIARVGTILLVELKRGGFEISSKERNQAQGYVEAIVHCGIVESPKILSFVVGDSVDSQISTRSTIDNNSIQLITYSHIVDTASKRLFRLREAIQERYENITGERLAQRVIQDHLF